MGCAMFEKDLHIAYLLDFYGDVLPEKARRVMEYYYDEDLSLAEIAEGEGISRQGVRHLIKRGGEELDRLETALGLAAHYAALQTAANRLASAAQECGAPPALEEAIRSCIDTIHNA